MLPDGTGIIFAGGINSASEVQRRSVERYNVRTGIAEAVVHQDAILVAGGNDIKLGELKSCEMFNPTTLVWHTVASMHSPHYYHSATRLAHGNVLVVGGFGAVELYDVNADSWSYRGVLNTPRSYHSANVIYDLPNRWVTAVPIAMLSTA